MINDRILVTIISHSFLLGGIMSVWGFIVFPAIQCTTNDIIYLLNCIPTITLAFLLGVTINKI
jgi:hypothetical protein